MNLFLSILGVYEIVARLVPTKRAISIITAAKNVMNGVHSLIDIVAPEKIKK